MHKIELDISMGRKHILNYNYLDEARERVNGKEYRLYFVLLGEKYRIKAISSRDNILNVLCMSEYDKEVFWVPFDMLASLRAKDINCLNVEIIDAGNKLHIEYSEVGIDFLKKNFPNEYVQYEYTINTFGEFWIEIHVDNLMSMVFSNDAYDHVRKYEVLYIGKSKQEDIFDRLGNHSTMQKIHREIGKKYIDKELYILLSGVSCKVFDRQYVKRYNTEFMFSNLLGNQFQLMETIHIDEAIDIAEALLIAHFKPEYNSRLKEAKSNLKTYSKFRDVNVQKVYFSLDLYWEMEKEKSILFSDEISTVTKARVITCSYENDEVEITYEDLDDKIY